MPLSNPVEVVFLSQTVDLTNAQIKALPTTGVEVLPAPDADQFYLFQSCSITFHLVQDYAAPGDPDAFICVRYKADAGGPDASLRMPMAWSFTDFGAPIDVTSVFWPKLSTDGAGAYFSQTGLDYSSIKGQPLYIYGSNIVAFTPTNLTGGNVANAAALSVTYRVIDAPF